MEDRDPPHLAIRIFGPFLFIFGASGALFWFFYRTFELVRAISTEVVFFDKGSFYMLGVGIGMLALAFACIQEGWFGQSLSQKQTPVFSTLAITGVVLVFTFPHVVHYVLGPVDTNFMATAGGAFFIQQGGRSVV